MNSVEHSPTVDSLLFARLVNADHARPVRAASPTPVAQQRRLCMALLLMEA